MCSACASPYIAARTLASSTTSAPHPRANDAESTQGRIAARWTPNELATIDASVTFARLTSHGNYNTYPQLGEYVYDSSIRAVRRLLQAVQPHRRFRHGLRASDCVRLVPGPPVHRRALVRLLRRGAADAGVLLPSQGFQINSVKDATQEIRLVSRQDQKLRWSVGPSTNSTPLLSQDVYSPASTPHSPTCTAFRVHLDRRLRHAAQRRFLYGTIDVQEHQSALFGEVTYEVVPKVDVTSGALFQLQAGFQPVLHGCRGALVRVSRWCPTHHNVIRRQPRVVVDYKPTDNLMFFAQQRAASATRRQPASASVVLRRRPRRAHLTNAPPTFGPTICGITHREKGTFWNGRIVANVTASTSTGAMYRPLPAGLRLSLRRESRQVKSRGSSWRTAPRSPTR